MDGEQPSISQPKHCRYASTEWFRQILETYHHGLINPEDNEATEKKAEQLALDSSTGLAHHPKMGAYSYTLPSVSEPPCDSKPGPQGVPANLLQSTLLLLSPGGLAARAPLTSAMNIRVHLLGKPRIQRPRGFADTATNGQGQGQGAQAGAFVPTCPARTTFRL